MSTLKVERGQSLSSVCNVSLGASRHSPLSAEQGEHREKRAKNEPGRGERPNNTHATSILRDEARMHRRVACIRSPGPSPLERRAAASRRGQRHRREAHLGSRGSGFHASGLVETSGREREKETKCGCAKRLFSFLFFTQLPPLSFFHFLFYFRCCCCACLHRASSSLTTPAAAALSSRAASSSAAYSEKLCCC